MNTDGNAAKWLMGIVASVIAGVIVVWLTGGSTSNSESASVQRTQGPTITPTWTLTPTITPTVTATSDPTIWREGNLILPIDGSYGADLDNAQRIIMGTSISGDADVVIQYSPGGSVIGPTSNSSFTAVNDSQAGRTGCSAVAGSPITNRIFSLGNNATMGMHFCMVTSQNRIAEFELIRSNSSEVEISFTVWKR